MWTACNESLNTSLISDMSVIVALEKSGSEAGEVQLATVRSIMVIEHVRRAGVMVYRPQNQ